MRSQPFLTGHTIELRVPLDSDVLEDNWHNWYNDINVTRHNSHGVFPIGQMEELQIVHNKMSRHDTLLLAVIEKETQRLVGNAALQRIDFINRHCNIAITIGEKAPISTGVEVFGLLVEHAFMRLNLNRIEDATHEKSLTFVKMLEVLGFKIDGRGKQYFLRDNVWSDKVYFSLLADDFYRLRAERAGHILFPSHTELLSAIKNSVLTPKSSWELP